MRDKHIYCMSYIPECDGLSPNVVKFPIVRTYVTIFHFRGNPSVILHKDSTENGKEKNNRIRRFPYKRSDAYGQEQFSSLIARVRELGSVPVIISLPPIISDIYFSFFSRFMNDEQKDNVVRWLGGDVGIIARWHESYNRALFKIAGETGTQIIDVTTPFDTYRGNLASLYCPDGIHPNAEGHRLIAETIIKKRDFAAHAGRPH